MEVLVKREPEETPFNFLGAKLRIPVDRPSFNKHLYSLYLNKELTDLLVTTEDGGSFAVHRVVVAYIPYFRNHFRFATTSGHAVHFKDISKKCMAFVIAAAYGKEVNISDLQFGEELRKASRRLDFRELAEKLPSEEEICRAEESPEGPGRRNRRRKRKHPMKLVRVEENGCEEMMDIREIEPNNNEVKVEVSDDGMVEIKEELDQYLGPPSRMQSTSDKSFTQVDVLNSDFARPSEPPSNDFTEPSMDPHVSSPQPSEGHLNNSFSQPSVDPPSNGLPQPSFNNGFASIGAHNNGFNHSAEPFNPWQPFLPPDRKSTGHSQWSSELKIVNVTSLAPSGASPTSMPSTPSRKRSTSKTSETHLNTSPMPATTPSAAPPSSTPSLPTIPSTSSMPSTPSPAGRTITSREEMLNEMLRIEICRAYAEAQRTLAQQIFPPLVALPSEHFSSLPGATNAEQQSSEQRFGVQWSMPHQAMPQQTMPQQALPQQSMPQQTIPQPAMPQPAMPQQAMPQQPTIQQYLAQRFMQQQSTVHPFSVQQFLSQRQQPAVQQSVVQQPVVQWSMVQQSFAQLPAAQQSVMEHSAVQPIPAPVPRDQPRLSSSQAAVSGPRSSTTSGSPRNGKNWCNKCGREYGNFRRHLELHESTKVRDYASVSGPRSSTTSGYACVFCPTVCALRANLKQHMLDNHQHKPEFQTVMCQFERDENFGMRGPIGRDVQTGDGPVGRNVQTGNGPPVQRTSTPVVIDVGTVENQ